MRIFAFLLSVVALIASVYFFITGFKWSLETTHLIYEAMLLTLIFICILGLVVNYPFNRTKKKFRTMIYNSYSVNRIRNKQFDSQYELS